MNKRQLKKRERLQELDHEHELEKSPWGRIMLSYEHLQEAFEELVDTVTGEAALLRKGLTEQLLVQVKSVDQELTPRVAKLPLVGSAMARGIHQIVAVAS
jgi:hypothetical protein